VKPDDLAQPAGTGSQQVPALLLRAGQAPQPLQEAVIDEQPLALEINGIAHAVMLATPLDLEDFALGFLFTEGLIDGPAELLGVEPLAQPDGLVLQLQVTARCEARFKARRRTLAGRTGCGLCGVETLDQLQPPATPVPAGPQLSLAALSAAVAALAAQQPLQHLTGAVHAAAWCNTQGDVLLLREDVGRHNALDKLVGALLRAGTDTRQGFAVVTSRASVEMVSKAARAGIGLLAAVSGPTGRAVEQAQALGLTLAGFVRGDRATLYTHPQRLQG
jgi:FdhD protein